MEYCTINNIKSNLLVIQIEEVLDPVVIRSVVAAPHIVPMAIPHELRKVRQVLILIELLHGDGPAAVQRLVMELHVAVAGVFVHKHANASSTGLSQ